MAKSEKPTGNPPLPNLSQEEELLSRQTWATFRRLQPEFRGVIKKLAKYKRRRLQAFYEDLLNSTMLKMAEYRIGRPRKSPVGAEFIQVGYANIAGLLLSRLKDKERWLRFQNTLLKHALQEYWRREFLDKAVSNEGLDWMVQAASRGLPVIPDLFGSNRQGLEEDRNLIQRLMKELKAYSKFKGKKISKENLRLYRQIEEEHEALLKRGASCSWRTAVNIVAQQDRRSPSPLYKRFMKYKNRLYAKSPKNRLT